VKDSAAQPIKRIIFFLLSLLLVPLGHGEDWTVHGKTFHQVRVIKVNADTVSITYDGGAGRIDLTDLTPELQKKFSSAAKEAQAFAIIEKNAATDSIAYLEVKFSSTHGMWVNGGWQAFHLSQSAPAEELMAKVWKSSVLDGANGFKIVRAEQMHFEHEHESPEPYTAVLVQTDRGDEKIVIFENVKQTDLWFCRVYDAEL